MKEKFWYDYRSVIWGVWCISIMISCALIFQDQLSSKEIIFVLCSVAGFAALFSKITTAEKAFRECMENKSISQIKFAKHVKHLIRRRKLFSICFVDLNAFKLFNDRYGHHAGDAVLDAFKRKLDALVSYKVYWYRAGGDEFILVLEDYCQKVEAIRAIQEINGFTMEIIDCRNTIQTVSITFAMGVVNSDEAITGDGLKKIADSRMYAEKEKQKFELAEENEPKSIDKGVIFTFPNIRNG